LSLTVASTSSELIEILQKATSTLKKSVKNSISLSAGCDLFLRFVLRNIHEYRDWEACKKHLVENGRVFAERAKASREKIAQIGLPFVRDDDVILVHGRSRAVSALLLHAASKYIRFRVYVTEARVSKQGNLMARILRENGIPVCQIPDSAVGYVIDKVDKIFLGAEGVAESGGVINQLGSYQIAVLASTANKPVYVLAESHKFVRLYPLSPSDLPTEYPLEFTTDLDDRDIVESPQVDFTPHQYVTALITDLGTLTPSGVSEELIKIWFD
jgi:translation initiation factor eIF-2B subunit alpha